MKKTIPFRITFPVAKAETREDGMYLTGEASGPEIDATNERMSPECVKAFAEQVTVAAAAGTPLTYRDAHAPDGVFRDLGDITRAWVDENCHLGIEVKLYDDSPASQWLFKQIIDKKKKFGMSVAGSVRDYVDEMVAGVKNVVRTYKDVMLSEISNTTRPAWTPSFGTVLSKAIDEATAESLASEGENVLETTLDQNGDATPAAPVTEPVVAPVVEPVVEVPAADAATEKAVVYDIYGNVLGTVVDGDDAAAERQEDAEDAQDAAYLLARLADMLGNEDDADKQTMLKAIIDLATKLFSAQIADVGNEAPDDGSGSVAMSNDTAAADLQKSGRSLSAANAKRLTALRDEMSSLLTDCGVETETPAPAKKNSEDAETTLEKSLTVEKAALVTQVEDLQRSLTEKTARIEELENMPATAPALVTRNDEVDLMAELSKMKPQDRIRMGLALTHQAR